MNVAAGLRKTFALVTFLAAMQAHAAGESPPGLPAQDKVRSWLERLPELRVAREGIELARAHARHLNAGPYEWTVKGKVQRRTERDTSASFREQEIALERPVRWMGKAGKDAALGEQRVKLASYAFAEAWHEAGRSFLQEWFDTLREVRAAASLQEQAMLHEQQVDLVRKRFNAGDAPRLEVLLAEAERDRAVLAQQQAAQRAARVLAGLQARYAGVDAQMPGMLPQPQPLPAPAEDWVRRIVTANHELAAAKAEAELARLGAERALLDRRPDPTLGVHVAQERGGQEKIFGVTISIPIAGDARRAQQDIGASEAHIAQEKVHQAQGRVEREARAAAMAAATAYDNWERLVRIAEKSQATTALVAKAYSLGEVPLGDLILARRQSTEAAGSAESARVDALHAHARLLLDAHAFLEIDVPGIKHDGHSQ